MSLDPMSLVHTAAKAVPSMRYAVAVAGIVGLIALARQYGINNEQFVQGTIAFVIVMVLLVVFGRLAKNQDDKQTPGNVVELAWPAKILVWFCLLLFLATAGFFWTHYFLGWPTCIGPSCRTPGPDNSLITTPVFVTPDSVRIEKIKLEQSQAKDRSDIKKQGVPAAEIASPKQGAPNPKEAALPTEQSSSTAQPNCTEVTVVEVVNGVQTYSKKCL